MQLELPFLHVHHDNQVWSAVGEPTEIALHVLALRFHFGKDSVMKAQSQNMKSNFRWFTHSAPYLIVVVDSGKIAESKCSFWKRLCDEEKATPIAYRVFI
jgi:hypothetical protein